MISFSFYVSLCHKSVIGPRETLFDFKTSQPFCQIHSHPYVESHLITNPLLQHFKTTARSSNLAKMVVPHQSNDGPMVLSIVVLEERVDIEISRNCGLHICPIGWIILWCRIHFKLYTKDQQEHYPPQIYRWQVIIPD
ncbi:hypothetical protein ACTA71_010367 [Dictyostelium dimigraforme]